MAVERIQVKPAREVELLRKKKAEEERKKRNAVGGESSSSLNALMINHIITMGEVEQTKMRFHCEKVGAEHKLEVKLGQLAYLRNLKGIQKDTAETNGENQDECPICRSALGTSWMVLGCGHCFCANCLDELQKRVSSVHLLISDYSIDSSAKIVYCRFQPIHLAVCM